MTRLQRLQLRRSENRERINELTHLEERSEEENAELARLVAEYQASEVEFRALVIADGEGGETRTDPTDPESRELAVLAGRVELRNYVARVIGGGQFDGAERELQEARGLAGDAIPWDAFAPRRVEAREDVATPSPADVGAAQNPILARVFAESDATFCGVNLPMVGVGEANYPVLTSGQTPEMKPKDGTVEAAAGTITATVITPTRLTARVLWRLEDQAALLGMGDALRRDLVAAMGDAMDRQIVAGSGVAPNVSGLLAGAITIPEDDPGAVSTLDDFIPGDSVDGKHARDIQEVRQLLGAGAYRLALVSRASNGELSGPQHLAALRSQIRVSERVPAAASNIELSLAIRRGGAAYAPVWEGVRLIPDDITGAAEGHRILTAVALWGFKVARADGFKVRKYKLA